MLIINLKNVITINSNKDFQYYYGTIIYNDDGDIEQMKLKILKNKKFWWPALTND